MPESPRPPELTGRRQLRGRRVLFVSTDMGMGGGAEEQVIQLAYSLQERGWGCAIASMIRPSPMPEGFERRGIPLHDLGMSRGVPSLTGIIRLAHLIRRFRPLVVHSHMVHANLLTRAVRAAQPFPVLINTHQNLTMAGVKRDRSRVWEIAHRLTDRWSDRTTGICDAASDYCIATRAAPAEKVITIPNGIDTAQYSFNEASRQKLRAELGLGNSFTWLAVGRLELQKAYPTLLNAVRLLASRDRKVLICGQGTLAGELKALTERLGLGDVVRFMGLRGDIPALMSAADAFALSSDMEGLPLVLLQAAAAGLPAVATNVSGNPDVVLDRETGRLTPPGDWQGFAAAMGEIENLSPTRRREFSEAAVALARSRFDIGPIADRWEVALHAAFEFAGSGPRSLAEDANGPHRASERTGNGRGAGRVVVAASCRLTWE